MSDVNVEIGKIQKEIIQIRIILNKTLTNRISIIQVIQVIHVVVVISNTI